MHNEKLFYLLCVEKLAPDHMKDNPPSQSIGLSIVLFRIFTCSGSLGSRQSPVYNQDLDFQLNFKSKLGKPIHEKRMIHLLNLKELHLEHILALSHAVYHQGLLNLPSNEAFRYYIGRYKCCLNNVKFRLSWKSFGTSLMKGYPIYSIKNVNLRVFKCHIMHQVKLRSSHILRYTTLVVV